MQTTTRTPEEKRAILATIEAAVASGTSASMAAKAAKISLPTLYTWRAKLKASNNKKRGGADKIKVLQMQVEGPKTTRLVALVGSPREIAEALRVLQ